jgi:asparagine N-glycosylation enzyme membrane subunit Stt3
MLRIPELLLLLLLPLLLLLLQQGLWVRPPTLCSRILGGFDPYDHLRTGEGHARRAHRNQLVVHYARH